MLFPVFSYSSNHVFSVYLAMPTKIGHKQAAKSEDMLMNSVGARKEKIFEEEHLR